MVARHVKNVMSQVINIRKYDSWIPKVLFLHNKVRNISTILSQAGVGVSLYQNQNQPRDTASLASTGVPSKGEQMIE